LSQTKRVELIPAKRHAMIISYLRTHGAASIGELVDATQGSISTIRRDLEQLEAGSYIERTHGGARLPPVMATFERERTLNAHLQSRQKAAIGREAASRLVSGQSVICDSGSTVLEALKVAVNRDIFLTVVTNSLDVAQLCSNATKWQVIMPGGTVRSGMNSLYGEPGYTFFNKLHADLCLVGAYAINEDSLTDATIDTATLKKAMISSARRTIILADSSKFTVPSFLTSCSLSEVQELITDDGIPPKHLEAVRSHGVEVTAVAADPGDQD
jgi:DeoR/GlpR family transcriptional regulator of sugar metabolism